MSRNVLWALLAALLVLTALPGTAAADCSDDLAAIPQEQLQAIADAYNEEAGDMPDLIAGQIAGERVELRVTGNADVVYTVVFDDDAHISSIAAGSDDPTLRVTVTGETLCAALEGEDPGAVFASAYESGDITIEGVGTVNALKVTVMKTVVSIAQFFGLF